MQYLALLIGSPEQVNAPGTPAFDEEMAAYARFDEKYGPTILGGNALEMEESPTTVRSDGDQTLVVDGPYAETAEGVGGYYVLEAPSLDEAIEMAADLPQAELGCVELRPLVVWQDFSPAEPGPAPEGTKRYVALIRGKETDADDPTSPAWEPAAQEHRAFAEAAGTDLWEGLALHPVAMSTTVRRRDGEVLVTDGPYPEVAEIIGGAYAFGPVTRERAIELAAQIPADAIELLPVMEVG
jgi:hypothetical protein